MNIKGVITAYRSLFDTFRRNKRADYFVIGLLVAVVIILNLLWRQIDLRPPHWDMARHLFNSLQYLDLFTSHSPGFLNAYFYYPPLVYWTAVPFQILFHPSIESAVASNIVFIAILAYATYGLGRTLWSRHTGLLASFFVLTAPMMVSQFKEFQVDAPLAAMTALSLLFLIKAKEFTDHKYSLLFGVSLGLGMLTKWTFPFIMLLPLTLMVGRSVVKLARSRNTKIIYNAVAAAVLTYAIAGIWYVTNLHQIKIDLTQNSTLSGVNEGDPVVGTFASNVWHLNNLMNNHLRLAVVLLVVGLIFFFLRRKNLKQNIYPVLLVVGSVLFFTVLRNKDARYILPVMPAVAVLSVYWFDQLKPMWRRCLTYIVVAYGVVVFWAISFGLPFLPQEVSLNVGDTSYALFSQSGYIIGAPTREKWHQEEVFQYISGQNGVKTLSYSGDDTIWFNNWGLAYYSTLYGVGLVNPEAKPTYFLTRTIVGKTEPTHPGTQPVKAYILPDASVLRLYRTAVPVSK
jgi:4-amino-4-deoxy-L-arabinose transferase-like glycosyltransferase